MVSTNYMDQQSAIRVSVTGLGREKPLRIAIQPSSSTDQVALLPTIVFFWSTTKIF